MPLTRLQHRVAEVLRPFRDEHNFVAGGMALNQRWPRLSDDMDIFHDRRNQLPNQVEPELRALDAARRYCEEVAPPDYLGYLFVDENDEPVEADAAALAIGSVRAIPLTDFSTVPAIGDSAPGS